MKIHSHMLMEQAGGGDGGGGTGAAGGAAGGSGAGGGSGQAGAGGEGGGNAGGSGAAPSWDAGFDAETKGYLENKGFKDPKTVVQSYQNLEKLLGKVKGKPEQVAVLPDREDDVEGFNAIYDRLGRPKDPKEYKLDIPADAGDETFQNFMRDAFHKTGLSQRQAAEFSKEWAGFIQKAVGDRKQATEAQIANDTTALKKEWGNAYDKNVEMNKGVLRAFGAKPEVIDKLEAALGGHSETMKFLNSIAIGMGEEKFISGNGGDGAHGAKSPAAAQAKIKALMSDSTWTARYLKKEASAVEEMEHLQKMANPDT